MGNLLAVVVHAANIHDTKAGIWAAKKAFETYPSIQRFCADAGYRKTFEQDVSSELGLGVDISARIKPVWEVLPKRWRRGILYLSALNRGKMHIAPIQLNDKVHHVMWDRFIKMI